MAFPAQARAPLAQRSPRRPAEAFPYRRLAWYAVGACLLLYAAFAAALPF